MDFNLESDWQNVLAAEFQKEYFKDLEARLAKETQEFNIFPEKNNIFKAFSLCSFSEVKVVILGQDPYHRKNQAQGLAFSVPEGEKIPPSLRNIYKEINSDLGNVLYNAGDLENWARQGVLLLNACLTVQEGKANSHKKLGWENFTDKVIEKIAEEKAAVVFLLWGKFAHEKERLIKNKNHLILKAPHPSPLSSYTGFFGCRHFSQTNIYLKRNNLKEINW